MSKLPDNWKSVEEANKSPILRGSSFSSHETYVRLSNKLDLWDNYKSHKTYTPKLRIIYWKLATYGS